jgi:PAS domain S-box-containing protein
MFFTDMLIGAAYVGISLILVALVRRVRIPFSFVVLCFGTFIAACGGTHFMEVWTLWYPYYWWAAGVKLLTAIASVGTGVYLFQLRHPIVVVAEAAKLSEQRRLDLEALTETLEQRVAERTERLQLALDATGLGTWELDIQTRQMTWDEQTKRIFSSKFEKFESSYEEVDERIHPDDRSSTRQTLERAIQNRTDFVHEYRIVLPDGRIRWIAGRARVSYDASGDPAKMIGTALDISEQKELERYLSEGIHTRDEFISIASHELKTPVSSMRIQIQMLDRLAKKNGIEAVDPTVLQKTVNISIKQLDRLNRLINDMLDISRMATGNLTLEKEEVHLDELAQEVIERLNSVILAAGCQVHLEVEGKVEGIWDRLRIDQVISNLISNATKYAAGQPIEISIKKGEGETVCISVQDHGPGIPEDDQRRIFQRFERAVPHTGITGLGLGLYISRQIVELHGGKIRVESSPNHGSNFIVELPFRSSTA